MRKRFAIALAVIIAVVLTGVYIMPHGYPPWSGVKKQTVFSLPIDMGELAVRLGSIVSYDRRGDVVLLDDFGDGLSAWDVIGSGLDSEAFLSAEKAESPPYSIKAISGKTVDCQAGIMTKVPTPVSGLLGLEAHYQTQAAQLSWRVQLTHYNGTTARVFGVKYDHPNTQLEYLNSANVWTAFDTDVELWLASPLFHALKLVADPETGKYERLLVDDKTYTLRAYDCYEADSDRSPHTSLVVDVEGDTDASYTAYLDDVIFTQNEP